MLRSSRVLEIILFFYALFLYTHNLARGIYAGDTGLLVSAAYVGGVPHPPGYPLFTLVGFLLTRLSITTHLSPAFLVGLISVAASAVGLVIYFRISLLLINNKLISFISSLILSTVFLFWFYAEIPEVFALNNLFVLLLIYLVLLYTRNQSARTLTFLGLTVGLSLSNHLTIVLLFPTLLLILYPYLLKQKEEGLHLLVQFTGAVAIGLLPYLYIISASLAHPRIDWAHITDIRSFIAFVSRERYGTLSAGSFADPGIVNRVSVLAVYLSTMISQLTLPVVFLIILGCLRGLIKRKRVEIALLLGVLLSGPLFVVYAGFPLDGLFAFGVQERFLSMSVVLLLIYFPLGLSFFSIWLGKYFSKPFYATLFAGIFILIPIQLFIFNFPKTNLSSMTVGDTFGTNYLKELPKNSILLLSSDTSLFNTMYRHDVIGERKDILLLNSEDSVQVNKRLSIIGQDLQKPTDEKEYGVVMLANLATIDVTRPVFSEKPLGTNDQIVWIPYGMVYELHRSDEKKLSKEEFKKRTKDVWGGLDIPYRRKSSTIAAHNLSIAAIYNSYAWSFWHTAAYFYKEYNDTDGYADYLLKATEVDPNFHQAYAGLGTYFLSVKKNCNVAILNFEQAHEKDSLNKRYFQLLAIAFKECHTDKGKSDLLYKQYEQLFHEKLQPF